MARRKDVRESIESFLVNTLPSPTHWLTLAAIAVAAVVVAVLVFVRSRPAEVTYSTSRPRRAPLQSVKPKQRAVSKPQPRLAVHVAGRVQSPQVIYLASGSRVIDAVKAAGGPTDDADTNALNLAARVVDGERVYVPAKGEAPSGPAVTGAIMDSSGLIDINQASSSDLEELDGIGPVLAERIVKYRVKIGRFQRVGQLQDVDGIGPKKLSAIEGQVRVR